jgi:DNA-binding NarL/FixJ family response regulator
MRLSSNPVKTAAIKLYIIEEQEIFRGAYRAAFSANPTVELLGICGREGMNQIGMLLSQSNPDVLLIGVKVLKAGIVEELIRVRKNNPRVSVILLAMNYDIKDVDLIRGSLTGGGTGGISFFSKRSLDEVGQLSSIVASVSRGEVTLDRLVTVIFNGRSDCEDLKELTARELEILSLLSMGYTNQAIAESLGIDVKTVKHHINSMYSKLNVASDLKGRHPRVSAARMYLEGNGFHDQAGVFDLG